MRCAGEPLAKRVNRARTSDVIDATVVVGALARCDLVVTSDGNDITAVAAALDASIEIIDI